MSKPTIITSREAVRDIELPPQFKLRHERYLHRLGALAQHRQTTCWMSDATGCSRAPIVHVQEVGFDLRDIDATTRVAMLSSADLTGPVPGLCPHCLATAPPLLAEAVYSTRREMQFGLRPTRWFVRFTDGSTQSGPCQPFKLHRAEFSYIDRTNA